MADPLPTTTASGPARTENPKPGMRAAEDPNNGAKRRGLSGRPLWSGPGGGLVSRGMSVRECARPESIHSQAEQRLILEWWDSVPQVKPVPVVGRHSDWEGWRPAQSALEGEAQPAAGLVHVRPGRRRQTRIPPPKAAPV